MNIETAINTINQYRRMVTGDTLVIGDVVKLSEAAGGGHAIALWNNNDVIHVTGIYEDGMRWWEFVAVKELRFATPHAINKLARAFEAAGEMDSISRELAYNAQEWEMNWANTQAASA